MAGETQHDVAGAHVATGEDAALFDCTDGEAGKVVFAVGIHAGHFGRLSADEGTSAFFAAAGDAAHHGSRGVHVKVAAGKVVQEEERLGTLHQHVVHAHGHEVDADAVVHVPLEGQTQLGAHTVRAGDQHGLAVPLGDLEECAKAADAGQHPLAHGLLGQGLDAFDESVACVDVNAGVFVGNGGLHGSERGKARWRLHCTKNVATGPRRRPRLYWTIPVL